MSNAVLSVLWFLSSTSLGASFAGGAGEPNDPYQIATGGQLISIGSDPALLSRHFVLVADIDLDPNLPGGTVFTQTVIAPWSQTPFAGSLDGAGHVIKNLHIVAPFITNVGLFGYVAATGTVKNLGLEKATIASYMDNVGGLAVRNDGSLSGCHLSGSVIGGPTTGGLVGDNRGTITLCHTTCGVTGSSIVGGLVGSNSGTITRCYATGSVTGTKTEVGGLVGENDGLVASSYSTGCVIGLIGIGGLVGDNEFFGSIICCYSTGDVSGDMSGGLVGSNYLGIVASSYSTGSVTGGRTIGGLAGMGEVITDSYFLAPSDGGGPDNGWGTALTAAQMKQQGTFVGFNFWGNKADGLNDEWFMPNDRPPILAWQTDQTGLQAIPNINGLTPEDAQRVLGQAGFIQATEVKANYDSSIPQGLVLRTYPPSYTAPGGTVELVVSLGPYVYDWTTNPGNGSVARPYQMQDANQLDSLADHPDLWGMHFVLTADINMAGRTYSKALIAQDEDGSQADFQGTAFAGSFDGQGFKILNLGIVSKTNDYLGLFGYIAEGALVRRVELENVSIKGGLGTTFVGTGSDYVGTVAGYNAGTISDCSVRGSVFGHSYVGRVTGANSGVVENCHAEEVLVW